MREKEGGAKREACLGLRGFVRVPQRGMPSFLSRWLANVRPKGEYKGLELPDVVSEPARRSSDI